MSVSLPLFLSHSRRADSLPNRSQPPSIHDRKLDFCLSSPHPDEIILRHSRSRPERAEDVSQHHREQKQKRAVLTRQWMSCHERNDWKKLRLARIASVSRFKETQEPVAADVASAMRPSHRHGTVLPLHTQPRSPGLLWAICGFMILLSTHPAHARCNTTAIFEPFTEGCRAATDGTGVEPTVEAADGRIVLSGADVVVPFTDEQKVSLPDFVATAVAQIAAETSRALAAERAVSETLQHQVSVLQAAIAAQSSIAQAREGRVRADQLAQTANLTAAVSASLASEHSRAASGEAAIAAAMMTASTAATLLTTTDAALTYKTLPTAVACPANSTGASVPSGCACLPGYAGEVFYSATPPYYTGSCQAVPCPAGTSGTAPSCACAPGYLGTVVAVAGGYSSTCTVAACPTNAEGTAPSCACKPGFSGAIVAVAGGYSGACSAVPCPASSAGDGVAAGCTCNSGYTGAIFASTTSPYYTGECSPVPCPAQTTGSPLNCTCSAGFVGTVTPVKGGYLSSCTAVPCPANSVGTAPQCACARGYSGTITPATGGYTGACTAVSCPASSSGTSVATGCTCNQGFAGRIIATSTSPFYSGSCTLVACPAGTVGTAPSCSCAPGYTGSVTASVGGYLSTCTVVPCPAGSDGSAPLCACKPGYSGAVTAIAGGYTSTCQAVPCPDNSAGTSAPSGCACNDGYFGAIVSSDVSPYYYGSCDLGTTVPSKTIVTWSGAAAAIPSGWLLCDGNNGTPNMVAKFIVGGGATYVAGTTGGSSTVTLTSSNLPSHAHTASSTFTGTSTGTHSHDITDPGHYHLFFMDDGASNQGGYSRYNTIGYDAESGGSGSGGSFYTRRIDNTNNPDTTGVTVNSADAGTPTGDVATSIGSTGDGSAVTTMPPYYALCFIMKA
eukprot:m.142571 g.142571  ORF g.142571 m.142571 type:complete len:899 (+) comp9650_c1_seq5:761-3457(+)